MTHLDSEFGTLFFHRASFVEQSRLRELSHCELRLMSVLQRSRCTCWGSTHPLRADIIFGVKRIISLFRGLSAQRNMLFSAWVLSSLPALALAASAKYDKYRSLAQRHGGLVSLDANGYDELTAAPRDYSVTVVLTALGDAVKCGPCKCVHLFAAFHRPPACALASLTSRPPQRLVRLLQPEYAQLAKQWSSAKKGEDEEHIFAYLDFEKGPEIFQRVRSPPHLVR